MVFSTPLEPEDHLPQEDADQIAGPERDGVRKRHSDLRPFRAPGRKLTKLGDRESQDDLYQCHRSRGSTADPRREASRR